jgi:hypothetical protein
MQTHIYTACRMTLTHIQILCMAHMAHPHGNGHSAQITVVLTVRTPNTNAICSVAMLYCATQGYVHDLAENMNRRHRAAQLAGTYYKHFSAFTKHFLRILMP